MATPVLALNQSSIDSNQTVGARPGKTDVAPPDDRAPIPMPDAMIDKRDLSVPGETTPDATVPAGEEAATPAIEIIQDPAQLPEPVRRMRQLIMDAALTGDIEKLRPLLGKGGTATQVSSYEGDPADPIATLKGLSGDQQGAEVLAIMLDILSTGAALIDKDTNETVYVWPYVALRPIDTLTKPEIVDLLRIVTAGDMAEMQEVGGYNFYRLGIGPDGQWKFFLTGD
ncbi:hypothetical protein SAMN05880582_10136 [Rhizobium sp. RU20A]|uniref:hypothetical protein n=1 Tax=Rhizobium sp. RU20A TaxID=1907412 RepID=UPI0009552279|nr:hypothetical protein [Rhizobium sp. RU20A]SIP92425.1 hypothetical protein SAMN05880582_10136 [Rhizobium sp. RU20A]